VSTRVRTRTHTTPLCPVYAFATVLLDPEDVSNPDPNARPDERCMMTYVSHFPFAYLKRMQERGLQQPTVVAASSPALSREVSMQKSTLTQPSGQYLSTSDPVSPMSSPPPAIRSASSVTVVGGGLPAVCV
jgi:hypothetical protein